MYLYLEGKLPSRFLLAFICHAILGGLLGSCDSTSFNDSASTATETAPKPSEDAAAPSINTEAATAERGSEGSASGDEASSDILDDDDIISQSEIDAVNIACENGSIEELAETILFEEPADTCPWGENGNLDFDITNQLLITARLEQHYNLAIPEDAIICNMQLNFPTQSMRYDDEIFLLFNNFVMLASQDYTIGNELRRDQNDLVVYNWYDLRGKAYPIGQRPQFFVDKTCGPDCNIPPTQATGEIKFKIAQKTVRKLGLASGIRFRDSENPLGSTDNRKHRFSFVTFGDNDQPIDCMHADFRFDLKVSYVRP